MDAYELRQIVAPGDHGNATYHEFLRVPAMSIGIYRLKKDARDPQTPHMEDEVYHVAEGRGSIRVGSEDHEVGAGSIVFVRAGVDHRFHDIREDLVVLVVFAPAEGTNAAERA